MVRLTACEKLITIEVRYFRSHWKIKCYRSRVNLPKRKALLKDLRVGRGFLLLNEKEINVLLFLYLYLAIK